jgi:two-component system sensor histidine kinase GlrK
VHKAPPRRLLDAQWISNVNFPRPNSFLKLLLFGFAVVVTPLLVALAFAVIITDRMATQSQHAVYQSARATQNSRMLVEQVTAMERSARQYNVLGDKNLFNVYQETHEKFVRTVAELGNLFIDQSLKQQLKDLSHTEQGILDNLRRYPYNSTQIKKAVGEFEGLASQSREMLSGSQTVIDREVQVMYDLASNAQRLFFWFGSALIPIMVIIVVGITYIISRPVGQIEAAIMSLGDGSFSSPIEVVGPKNLEVLGERLDWLRQRLAEVEQEKIKFLRHVSHELKTPLTALREGTDLLADGAVGPLSADQKEVVNILGSNTAQLQGLIEDLLNFSRAHLKPTALEHDRVALDKLMRRVISDQKLAIISKQLKLRVKFEPVSVRGDKEKLRVVFDNLLSNAVKFSPRKGKVEIAIRKLGQHAAVDIRDAGPGITVREKERVFEAFYQGEAVAEGHIKGTGLGLSIARDYVQAHGGLISVNDKSTGGAHLMLRLPMEMAQEGA